MSRLRVKCPYCGGRAECRDSSIVYGRSYGLIWICFPCDAYVGCHRGTENPLGTLANAATREARKSAHGSFDNLWKSGMMTRSEAYAWLREKMGMTPEECHMAKMNEAQAREVCQLLHDFRQELKARKLEKKRERRK